MAATELFAAQQADALENRRGPFAAAGAFQEPIPAVGGKAKVEAADGVIADAAVGKIGRGPIRLRER